MIKAVIDIGTNSVRLCIAEACKSPAQGIVVLSKQLCTTRLGQGSANGILQPEAIHRTAQAVADFAAEARQKGAEVIVPYATAAVREASNKQEFLACAKALSGLQVQVLSGQQEAAIAFAGAAGAESSAVIDIGGGSTEVMVKHGGLHCMSRRLGAVRLQERFGGENGVSQGLHAEVQAYIAPEIAQYIDIHPAHADTLFGVSGTATTLAAMQISQRDYDPKDIQGMVLSLEDIRMQLQRLSVPLRERLDIAGLPAERADILPFGAIILESFMFAYGFDHLTVSDSDSLEGFLLLTEKGEL